MERQWRQIVANVSIGNNVFPALYSFPKRDQARASALSHHGKWTNELNSTLTLKLIDNLITGTYQTAVVSNPERNTLPPTSKVHGSFQQTDDGVLLTFNVQWRYTSEDGQLKQSQTTWILASNAPKDRKWSANTLNKDVFTKV